MTVEEVKTELESITSSLTLAGFGSIDAGIVEKLDKLTALADELNMKEGKRLIANLAEAMKSAKEGESKTKSCNVRLMALDFYVKKLSTVVNIEDY